MERKNVPQENRDRYTPQHTPDNGSSTFSHWRADGSTVELQTAKDLAEGWKMYLISQWKTCAPATTIAEISRNPY
jgi:hypothetical protein